MIYDYENFLKQREEQMEKLMKEEGENEYQLVLKYKNFKSFLKDNGYINLKNALNINGSSFYIKLKNKKNYFYRSGWRGSFKEFKNCYLFNEKIHFLVNKIELQNQLEKELTTKITTKTTNIRRQKL